MFAYLFHREAYTAVAILYGRITSSEVSAICIMFTSIIIFVVSYYTQICYDKILERMDFKLK